MLKISFKAIIVGCIFFVALFGVFHVMFNILLIGIPTHIIGWIAYSSLWALPGFIAAAIAQRLGILHGAIVGLIVGGTISASLEILFPSQSGDYAIAFKIIILAIFWPSLGGLVFDIGKSLTRK